MNKKNEFEYWEDLDRWDITKEYNINHTTNDTCDSKRNIINKLFSSTDNIYISCKKPPIKDIIDITIKCCNIKYKIISECPPNTLTIKGYKVIKICYEGCNSFGKLYNICFVCPIFEIIRLNSCDEVINVNSKICYCTTNMINRRLINISSILSIDVHLKEKDKNDCECTTSIHVPINKNCCLNSDLYDSKCYQDDTDYNKNWNLQNDLF